jgi:sulfide dehydrogenase cytochrome subunit
MRIAIAAVLLAATAPAMAQAVAPAGASACSGCHGAGTAVPALRGQRAEDITAAMQAFRTGARPATVMDRIAKGFTDEETRAIAAWVAQQR